MGCKIEINLIFGLSYTRPLILIAITLAFTKGFVFVNGFSIVKKSNRELGGLHILPRKLLLSM